MRVDYIERFGQRSAISWKEKSPQTTTFRWGLLGKNFQALIVIGGYWIVGARPQ
jgi:hypothetical protein